jgi:hypothetical protein
MGVHFQAALLSKNGGKLRKLTLNRYMRTRKRAQRAVAKAECGWDDMCTCKAMQRTYHKQNPVGQGFVSALCIGRAFAPYTMAR